MGVVGCVRVVLHLDNAQEGEGMVWLAERAYLLLQNYLFCLRASFTELPHSQCGFLYGKVVLLPVCLETVILLTKYFLSVDLLVELLYLGSSPVLHQQFLEVAAALWSCSFLEIRCQILEDLGVPKWGVIYLRLCLEAKMSW
jgi:hypothetical protein